MYLQYGSYRHASAECTVAIDQEPLWNKRDERYALRVSYDISGFLQAASLSALTTAILTLEAAYARDYQDIGLYQDDGTPTAHVLQSSRTISGNQVKGGVSYPNGAGAEYSAGGCFRNYRVRVEGEISLKDKKYLEFHESLMMTGGGPRTVYIETRNGPPIKQQVSQQTTYKAVQSGRALGQYGYPPIPGPLFPDAENQEKRKITPESPELRGKNYWEWPIAWSYYFEASTPLFGVPNKPPLV